MLFNGFQQHSNNLVGFRLTGVAESSRGFRSTFSQSIILTQYVLVFNSRRIPHTLSDSEANSRLCNGARVKRYLRGCESHFNMYRTPYSCYSSRRSVGDKRRIIGHATRARGSTVNIKKIVRVWALVPLHACSTPLQPAWTLPSGTRNQLSDDAAHSTLVKKKVVNPLGIRAHPSPLLPPLTVQVVHTGGRDNPQQN
jgi:hypothetical protein